MNETASWRCEVCGFIHTGDAPPDICPVCGVGSELFMAMETEPAKEAPESVSLWSCTICDHVHEGDAPPEICVVCGATRKFFEAEKQQSAVLEPDADVEKIVVLGAGIAGMTAAEQARNVAPGVAITLVSGEAGFPYLRLNLTRFLAGEVSEENLVMQEEPWFTRNRIDLIEGIATAIDRKERMIRLRDGRSLHHDRLVLANGSHPFVPPIPGVTLAGVMTFRTLQDAHEILERVGPDTHAICLGGGLLGLETAGALMKRGIRTTVLEGDSMLLPRQLAEPAGRLLRDHLESIGIDIRCGVMVKEITGNDAVRGVRLDSGEEIQADMVVLTTGVRPDTYLARQSDLTVKSGVIVDDRMTTSDPDILACGDVAEHRGVLCGIWPTAFAQGRVAGINAVGGNATYLGLPPSHRIKVLDIDLFSTGQFQPPDASYRMFEEQESGVYRRLVCRDNRLVGANLYGDTDLAVEIKEAVELGKQIPELTAILDGIPGFRRFLKSGG